MKCPQCASEQIIKNGRIHNGKPKYKCKRCGRQFVEEPQWRPVPDETKGQIQKLLCERISLAGIVRVTGVSARWLQSYVNALYAHQPRHATLRSKKNGV
jgi:transposase-like protein